MLTDQVVNPKKERGCQLVHFEVFGVSKPLPLIPLEFLPDSQESSFNVACSELSRRCKAKMMSGTTKRAI
jgi:hypothetical protein